MKNQQDIRSMWKHLPLIAFISFFSSTTDASVNENGSFFLRACGAAIKQADGAKTTPKEDAESLYCVAYVSGFADSVALNALFGSQLVCIPGEGITNEQLVRIFVKHLRDTPEMLHESGRLSLFISLKNTFPCSSQ